VWVELGIDRERCLDLVMSQIGDGESRAIWIVVALLEVDNDAVFAAMERRPDFVRAAFRCDSFEVSAAALALLTALDGALETSGLAETQGEAGFLQAIGDPETGMRKGQLLLEFLAECCDVSVLTSPTLEKASAANVLNVVACIGRIIYKFGGGVPSEACMQVLSSILKGEYDCEGLNSCRWIDDGPIPMKFGVSNVLLVSLLGRVDEEIVALEPWATALRDLASPTSTQSSPRTAGSMPTSSV
jgi:hypothetical protein